MGCFKTSCGCVSLVAGVIAGVILGVLYALGFVTTGIIFWAYLAIGVLGILLSPIYASGASYKGDDRCFCVYRIMILTAAVGTIVSSAVGLVVAGLTSLVATAIVLGVATLFPVTLLSLVICLTNCMCRN